MRGLVFVLMLGMAGCSTSGAMTDKVDPSYQEAMEMGRSAYEQGHFDVALHQYRQALDRAVLRDDVTAIHDAGFNLATVALAAHQPQTALRTLEQAEAALGVRGSRSEVDFALVRAASWLRLGRPAEALTEARWLQGKAVQPADRVHGAYLAGLAADDLGHTPALSEARRVACVQPEGREQVLNCHDLSVRMSLVSGQAAQALPDAEVLAADRRADLDYDGMRRALQLAVRAAQRLGRTEDARLLSVRLEQSAAMERKNRS